jgi:tRNA-dihydrouridine synthase
MAGVTNYPFRALCREFGAGLYVSEMITARPLVEGDAKTLRLAGFGPGRRRVASSCTASIPTTSARRRSGWSGRGGSIISTSTSAVRSAR